MKSQEIGTDEGKNFFDLAIKEQQRDMGQNHFLLGYLLLVLSNMKEDIQISKKSKQRTSKDTAYL